jgi:xanthine dehydrogenase YagR molybdenum-binding subunit
MNAIGQPLDRRDGHAKVTGQATFAAEWPLKNISHAVIVTSTIAVGRIKEMDTSKAEAAPGVIAVLAYPNAPQMKKTKLFDPGGDGPPGSAATDAHILHTDQIFWNGQPVAVVVAETLEQAQYAAELVRVTYDSKPMHSSLAAKMDRAHTPENVMGEEPVLKMGYAEGELERADFKTDHEYTTPPENHNPIEPHATIAHWEGDQLTVYDASQYIFGVRKMLAEKFSIKEENVRVLSPVVGGGFGSKGLAWPHVALAVAAAKVVDRPVKLVLTRQQVYRTVGGRPPTSQRVALSAGRDGKLTALLHTGVSATSTTNKFTEQFTFPARHLYASSSLLLGQKVVRLDIVPPTFMRAPGENPGTFALESGMDELSYELKMDPVQLRVRNDPEKDPTKGTPFSSRHFKAAYKLGAEKFGWAKRKPEPRATRDGQWLIGYGVATAYYPTYQNSAGARVRLKADGTALAQSGAQEMGMGTATAQAQNTADALGLPVGKVTFQIGDTRFPKAPVAGGSSQTLSVGAAVRAACVALKSKLLELSRKRNDSPFSKIADEDVEMRDGGLYPKGGGPGEDYATILNRASQSSVEAEGEGNPGDKAKLFSIHSYGAHFIEAHVHEKFGTVRIARVVSAFDVGKVLNAKTAASQFRGGIIMGIGMALMEETQVDPRWGRIMNPNLAEYHVPVHADIPEIEVHYLDIPDPQTPMGAHGIGEIGITGVAAAVANAVFHATGKRIRDLPITGDKLMS